MLIEATDLLNVTQFISLVNETMSSTLNLEITQNFTFLYFLPQEISLSIALFCLRNLESVIY